MSPEILKKSAMRAMLITVFVIGYIVWSDAQPKKSQENLNTLNSTTQVHEITSGRYAFPMTFSTNPYPHIPAQCYIETAAGTQNACLFCHTNGVWGDKMGNNVPQAGAFPNDIGNFQLEYSFGPYNNQAPLASVNRWENTLYPEKLAAHVASLGLDSQAWDMQAYIRQDNWHAAYTQRPSHGVAWDAGGDDKTPFRFLPAMDPVDLPAQADGFVRSASAEKAYFKDEKGFNTGWRAINFMPYGIFSPQTGSVSGIYIRLPAIFMQREDGQFDLDTYIRNLDLLAKAIQNRLSDSDGKTYHGMAKNIALEKGVYPVGTEFAHPLHYVDTEADGMSNISQFPGTRSQRVKEIRYMIKWEPIDLNQIDPLSGSEPLRLRGSDQQGWVNNGVGWYLVGFIEDAKGVLRPQTREEMTQCVGCHSGARPAREPEFTSGVGNTVDSTWAFPRQLSNGQGWQEMNYLGYVAGKGATIPEPINRDQNIGEYRLFLEHVVGANLYGQMPTAIEAFLQQTITTARGYSANWPSIDISTAEVYQANQKLRQKLMRELTAKGDYKDVQGRIKAELFYPPKADALAGAAGYRQVVVTQSFNKGKDVFPQTPHTFRALRPSTDPVRKIDDTAYAFGDIITERSIEHDNPASVTYRVGNQATEIDPDLPFAQGGNYLPNYTPFLK